MQRCCTVSIERLELRVAPPAARPVLRDQLRPRLRPHVHAGAARRRGRRRPGASAWPTPTRTTASETDRDGLAHHRRVPGAARAGRRRSTIPRDVSRPCARVRGHNMAKAARRDGGVGSLCAAGRACRSPACSAARARAIASGVSIGIQDSLDAARRPGRRGAGGRLPAHQDQDQARAGTSTPSRRSARASATIPLMVDANAAYRAGATPSTWPGSTRST